MTLIRFALPLLLGNLFQQLYNTVDSLVVGNFVGADALAAVSSSGHLIFMTIGLLQGMFIGAGVVIAHFFGAQDMERLRRSIHTTFTFAILAGIALSIFGVVFSPTILGWMGTPPSVLPNSLVYFQIYFSGLLSVVLYNCANGILQAVGDSRHPLYYLIFSSMLNVVLDLAFVIVLKAGVAGVAWATVISQASSATLAIIHLSRVDPTYRLSPRELRIDLPIMRKVLQMGIPSGIQNSIVSFSNVMVQTYINSFGAAAVAGSGTFHKLEGFALMPVGTFALAVTTFVGQNVGAGKYERAHKGVRFALFTSAIGGETLAMALLLACSRLLGAFCDDPEVVAYGMLMGRLTVPFYFFPALTHCMAGVLRGMGRAVVPMVTLMVCWCALRVVWLSVLLRIWHDIRLLYIVYPVSWALSAVVLLICYRKIDWAHGTL